MNMRMVQLKIETNLNESRNELLYKEVPILQLQFSFVINKPTVFQFSEQKRVFATFTQLHKACM